MTLQPQREQVARVAGNVPVADKRALEQHAKQNGRTLASEVRLAISAYLKAIGRRA